MSTQSLTRWLACLICALTLGLIGLQMMQPVAQSETPASGALTRTEARLTHLIEPVLGAGSFRLVVNPRQRNDIMVLLDSRQHDISQNGPDVQQLQPVIAAALGLEPGMLSLQVTVADFPDAAGAASVYALAEWSGLILLALAGLGIVFVTGRSRSAVPETPPIPSAYPPPANTNTSDPQAAAQQIRTWLAEAGKS